MPSWKKCFSLRLRLLEYIVFASLAKNVDNKTTFFKLAPPAQRSRPSAPAAQHAPFFTYTELASLLRALGDAYR